MAAEGDDFIRYVFSGADDEVIPQNATHFTVHESVKAIRAMALEQHQNIVELICHAGVKKIEEGAFFWCPSLKRVIIPGVEIIESYAFQGCKDLSYVECRKAERIERAAFCSCESLASLYLPSVKDIENDAFMKCFALLEVKFGAKLDCIGRGAFKYCYSLEKITIPLKNSLIDEYGSDTFQGCRSLKRVDLAQGTISKKWRNELNEEIDFDSINRILFNAPAGNEEYHGEGMFDEDLLFNYDCGLEGEKAIVIQRWITSILDKISLYKAEHHLIVDTALAALAVALPEAIVINNVFPFLEQPSTHLLKKSIRQRKRQQQPMHQLARRVSTMGKTVKNTMSRMTRRGKHG